MIIPLRFWTTRLHLTVIEIGLYTTCGYIYSLVNPAIFQWFSGRLERSTYKMDSTVRSFIAESNSSFTIVGFFSPITYTCLLLLIIEIR